MVSHASAHTWFVTALCTCLLALRSDAFAFGATSGSIETNCSLLPHLLFVCSRAMADAPAAQNQGDRRRRAEVRADRENEARNVRQRLDDTETRLDEVDSRLRGHETRLKCLEAPYRIVLRGFTSVREFMAIFDGGDFKGAKTAFIPSFVQELRDKTGPEVTQLVEELDTCDIYFRLQKGVPKAQLHET